MKKSKHSAMLFCAASLVALTNAARAQNTGTDQPVETVVVTGSRVISSAANSPTPLTIVSTDQLQATTPTNIPDALNKLPVFLGSQTGRNVDNASSNSTGNVLNLRNFGVQRTLVLLDGHRVAPTNANGTVDTDTLPQMLMERVDVVTGGASAVYGSDAVTGVVNFVLNTHFSGVKYDAGMGTNNEAYGTQYKAGIAAGTDLFGGRGHIEGDARYFHQDMVPISALPYGKNGQAWAQSGNGTAAAPYTDVPFGRLAAQPFNGLITCNCSANGLTWTANGALGPFTPGTPTLSPGLNSGGDGSYDKDGAYQASLRTAEAFGRFSYNLDDTTTAYVQATATESGNYATWYPDQRMNPGATHPNVYFTNNPFLPAAAQAALAAGNPGCPGGVPSAAAGCTFQQAQVIQTLSTGDALAHNSTYATGAVNRNLSVTVGVDGTMFGKYDWDLYYTHGESRQEEYNPRNTNNQEAYAAADAVLNAQGQAVCYVSTTQYASDYPGCVPINPFGVNTITPSAYAYPVHRTQYVMTNIMDDVGGSVSGNVFDLPAGPVKVALSGEARWLSLSVDSNASPTATVDCTGLRLCNPATPLWVQNVVADMNASENVYEFALEANVPVLKDVPLVQELSLDLAGRYTDYSTSGSVETWKIGFDYHVDDNVRFRGTASVDIRAPTLNDLYSPLQSTISGLTDLLTGQTFSSILHQQGNPDLVPEVAHTYTVGVVLTPDFVPGFTMSVDYYRINLSHGITSISYGTQAIQQLCLNSGGTSPYCSLVSRPYPITDTSPDNFPTYFVSESLNSATVRTEGVDIEGDYSFDMADVTDLLPGTVSLRGLLSLQPYVNTLTYTGGATTFTPMPKGRFTGFVSYQLGKWGINLQDTWMGSYSKQTLPTQIYTVPKVPSFNTLDMTVDRNFDVGNATADVYLSVQNLFNTQYPLWPTITSNPGLYYPTPRTFGNSIGRYFTIGIRGNL